MLLNRENGEIKHKYFYNLPDLLTANDVLVFNQSKVFPARLIGKKETGGKVEILLLHQLTDNCWEAISRPGLKNGQMIKWTDDLEGKVIKPRLNNRTIKIQFNISGNELLEVINKIGLTPIPPYIKSVKSESVIRRDYQTVYAREIGSAAAPTAGLHFTKNLLNIIKQKGIQMEFITLHVGLGTFQPIREENFGTNKLHIEYYKITTETARRLIAAKKKGKRIVSVGTTTARALESACQLIKGHFKLASGYQQTNIFIHPIYKFKFIDSLITNFHLPKSSLLMLVSAYVSYPNTNYHFTNFKTSIVGKAYQQAINKHYRFFSFGDAMWIG